MGCGGINQVINSGIFHRITVELHYTVSTLFSLLLRVYVSSIINNNDVSFPHPYVIPKNAVRSVVCKGINSLGSTK